MKGMNFRRLNPFQLNLAFHIENLSSDLHCKSNDWFLYETQARTEMG